MMFGAERMEPESSEVLMQINDSLSYIDQSISEEQRREVSGLVDAELAQMDTQIPHPALQDRFVPSRDQDFAFLKEIYRHEEMNDDLSFEDDFSLGGIDMAKYTDLTTETNDLNFDNLYASLSHSLLRKRSLTVSNLTKETHKNKWLVNNDQLAQCNDRLESELHQKRKAVDEINIARRKKQLEFQPTDEYLRTRWQDAVRGCVDVGVACATLELQELDQQDNVHE